MPGNMRAAALIFVSSSSAPSTLVHLLNRPLGMEQPMQIISFIAIIGVS